MFAATLSKPLTVVVGACLLVAGLTGLPGTAAAQTKPTVREVAVGKLSSALYIGNSFFYYNNSLHGHVNALLASATPARTMRSVSATISASGFGWHDVESYFRSNALSSYSFTADNRIVMNKFARLFDVAIMMDCSQCSVHPTFGPQFHEFAKKHSDTVRKHGAKPVFFYVLGLR